MNESELLFSRVLECGLTQLHMRRKELLTRGQLGIVSAALKRRAQGEPLEYILGRADFMGLDLQVDSSVLIPRPETEILVEQAIEYAKGKNGLRILDLGTGSGCIAIALSSLLKNVSICASDISAAALHTARKNASSLPGCREKIIFIQSDMFSGTDFSGKTFDIIITNPPYVAASDIASLDPEVKYQPLAALDGGQDGLHYYRRLSREAGGYLCPGGLMLCEVGYGQAPRVKEIFNTTGIFEIIDTVKDYQGIDRIVVVRKNN